MLAAAVACAALVLCVPSCISVLGLDGYRGAADELCALLERCYGLEAIPECMPHLTSALDAAEADDTRQWLVAFADESCLESCTTARRCLDLAPVCEKVGDGCDTLEKCCGFSKGLATCDTDAELCCRPKGTPCKQDEDCCANEGRCSEETGTCGGVVCVPSGEPCAISAECCTKICNPDGLCSEDVCLPDGADCSDDLGCCSLVCEDGRCGIIGCGTPGAECGADSDCCDGLTCFAGEEGLGVCSIAECLPELALCNDPVECCSGYCSPEFGQCGEPPLCLPGGASCELGVDVCCEGACHDGSCSCLPDLTPCTFDSNCCGGICEGSYCKPQGCSALGGSCLSDGDCCSERCNKAQNRCAWACDSFPNIGCSHDMCSAGGGEYSVLDPSCPDIDVDCVIEICTDDVYCCCTDWDDLCVGHVSQICGQSCAVDQ